MPPSHVCSRPAKLASAAAGLPWTAGSAAALAACCTGCCSSNVALLSCGNLRPCTVHRSCCVGTECIAVAGRLGSSAGSGAWEQVSTRLHVPRAVLRHCTTCTTYDTRPCLRPQTRPRAPFTVSHPFMVRFSQSHTLAAEVHCHIVPLPWGQWRQAGKQLARMQ
jgi:hypothetical protein